MIFSMDILLCLRIGRFYTFYLKTFYFQIIISCMFQRRRNLFRRKITRGVKTAFRDTSIVVVVLTRVNMLENEVF